MDSNKEKRSILNDNKIYRELMLKRNAYSKNDEYNGSHPNALSTGDEKGKDENGGQIGSSSDILARERMLKFKKFSSNNPYDSVDEQPI
jgi:hypothetical protein